MNNKILDEILNKYSIKEQDISCIENVGEMPIKRAIEVYNDNYNIQNILGETVFYGYEELLNNLRASTLEEVYLYVLELSNGKNNHCFYKCGARLYSWLYCSVSKKELDTETGLY